VSLSKIITKGKAAFKIKKDNAIVIWNEWE